MTGSYSYDANGNALTDRTGIEFTYNHPETSSGQVLNLPKTVTNTGTSISYLYDAMGTKLRRTSSQTGQRDYVSGIEYDDNGNIEIIQRGEGVAYNTGGTYTYRYNLMDHLGNPEKSGQVVRTTTYRNPITQNVEVLQQDDYYPFGKQYIISAGDNKYLYNGKELQEETGWYDYHARMYDPDIARWNVVDPLSEAFYAYSPYNYVLGNPINLTDPTGMYPYHTYTPGSMEWSRQWREHNIWVMLNPMAYAESPGFGTPGWEYQNNIGAGDIEDAWTEYFRHIALHADLAAANAMWEASLKRTIEVGVPEILYKEDPDGKVTWHRGEENDNFLTAVGMVADGASYKFGQALDKRMAWEISSAPYEKWKPKKVTSIGIPTPVGTVGIQTGVVKGVATGAKIGGLGLGVYNVLKINNDHNTGKISTTGMAIEQTSNAYSILGPYGAWWGLGWEIGRGISTTSGWQNWRDNTAVPAIGKAIDWFR